MNAITGKKRALLLGIVLLLVLVLLYFFLPREEKTPPPFWAEYTQREKAELFVNSADSIYFANGIISAFGSEYPAYIGLVDNIIGYPALTNGLASLAELDLDLYQESRKTAADEEMAQTFYTGVDGSLCEITLGTNAARESVTLSLRFPDQTTLDLEGPFSSGLVEAAGQQFTAFMNHEELDGNVAVTRLDGGSSARTIIQRGFGGFIATVLQVIMDHAEPLKSADEANYDVEVEVIGGNTYLVDTAARLFSVETDGRTAVYRLDLEDPDGEESIDLFLRLLASGN